MSQDEKKEYEKLLGKDYIERKVKRQVIKDRNGRKVPIIDIQKVTGLDEQGGITDAELDNIQEYDCQCVAEGRANYGGQCAICEATFCNKMVQVDKDTDRPTCYRRCALCHKKICMEHVRGSPDSPVYCSLKCYFLANPVIMVILGIAGLLILFSIIKAVFH